MREEVFINGQWVPCSLGGTLPVINPHGGDSDVIGKIGAGSSADIDAAVCAAREAFPGWSATSGVDRAKILRKIANLVRERKAELANLETIDMGKPIEESEWDIDDVAGCFEYFADRCEKEFGDFTTKDQDAPVPGDDFKGKITKEPLGVVGLITPWNYPLLMAVWKVAPALAAGCTCVLKPSELASLSCQVLCDIANDAGLPAGVLNVITGLGMEAGAALTAHKGVDKIAFTGSLATGRRVMASCAQNVTPCSLELGGKSALVIFDDVDINQAVEWALFGCFWTNGQICSATSRVLVHESISERFHNRLKKMAETIPIGNPSVRGCRLGPLVSSGQYTKVIGMVEDAKNSGCNLLTGGARPSSPQCASGYYISPTVFKDVSTDNLIWKEEIFGPVMATHTFATEEEAIALANDSDYALGAAVISRDSSRCARIARAFSAGVVWINCSQPCFSQLPWGGRKRSGYGRDLGPDGMDKYLHSKSIISYTGGQFGWYPGFSSDSSS